jgi:hypothetical protein
MNFLKKIWKNQLAKDIIITFGIFIVSRIILLILTKYNVPEVFLNNGFNLNRPELNSRFGSWDGDLYRKIAEGGYRYWQDLAVFSFLPGWPYILRTLHSLYEPLKVVEWGLLLNQVLMLPLIFMFLKVFRKLQFSTLSSIELIFLIIFYPSSAFFSFNYNEVIYLNGVLLIIWFWLNKKYTLAALVTLPFVLIRYNIVVILYGLVAYNVLEYSVLYFKSNYKHKETSISNFVQNYIKDGLKILKKHILTILLVVSTPLPLFMWFEIMKNRFGENLYFESQKTYFNREVSYILGVPKSLIDGFVIFKDTFPINPENSKIVSTSVQLGALLVSAIYGIHTWFTRNTKLIQIVSAVTIILYITLVSILEPQNWNGTLANDLYLNILPLFLIFTGFVGLWQNKNLRILLLPALFSIYLPLTTSTFTSVNRYLIQALPLIIGYYSLFLIKNKYLYYTILALFIAGYALFLHRFTHFQWAG